jgi:exodeoxyribonuclease-1
LLAILLRFRHYDEAALIWPVLEDGPTLKLEHLAAANGCDDGVAHDALADVRATVNIARLLLQRGASWRAALDSFSVGRDRATRDRLPSLSDELPFYRKGILLSAKCGKQCLYAAPVLLVGESATYRKQTYWLRLDDPRLCDRLESEPLERVWQRKKWGETPLVVPLDRVKLQPDQLATARANVGSLAGNPQTLQRLRRYASEYVYPEVEGIDADAQLYLRGFPNEVEQRARAAFHAADPGRKPALAAVLPHPVDRALACRLLWRNYGCIAGEAESLRPLLDEAARRDYKGAPKRTRADALAEISKLEAERAAEAKALLALREMRAWLLGAQ